MEEIYAVCRIDIPNYIGNVIYILVGSTIIAGILLYTFSGTIASFSELPKDWLWVVLVVAVGQFICDIVLVTWRAQDKATNYGIFRILLTSLNIGLAVIFIVLMGYGWEGMVVGKTIAYVKFGMLALFLLGRYDLLDFQFNKEYIRHAISYGMPLIPHVLSGLIITMIDRFFITNMVSLNETGIYSVGYQVGMIIWVLAFSFNKAWVPWLYEKLNEGNNDIKRKIVIFTYVYFIIIISIAIILSLMAPYFMEILVGKDFYGGTKYIFWIAISYSFNGMYMMICNYIFYEEKTYILFWLTLFVAGLNILLNYYFIQNYGAIGAAYSTTVTYFIQFLATWNLSSKTYDMPWFTFRKN